MPRTSYSLAAECSNDHELSCHNGEWERLAFIIESSEDRDLTLKLLRLDRQLVIDAINQFPQRMT